MTIWLGGHSGAVTGFAIDPADGAPTPFGAPLVMPGPARALPVDG